MPYTLSLGAEAPPFSLPATDGKTYTLKNFEKARALVLFFTCNHCPYVIHSDEGTKQTALKFKKENIEFVAINSNSSDVVPEDSFPHMQERMKLHHFPWVYLHDATQEIAQKYGALRTPHFFVFDQKRKLIYCGRAVDSPRDPSKIKVNDLENALTDFIQGRAITTALTNPIGCTLKWKGHDKHWMPPDACDLI